MSREAQGPGRIARLADSLTLEEQASLTAGSDMWNVPGVERVGIPPIRVTDGPNGARGSSMLGTGTVTAACLPCGSALGATWDPVLIEAIGALVGQEARTKSARFLLAPTLNLHRSPVAGRNFECYAEDPLLSGKTAAAFIRGVQKEGVAATPKHFVGNEGEFERASMSSDIDTRALRELYLRPFEIAIKEGGALAIMTAYNRLNGRFCTEDRDLLTSILREEWGFEGIVMTDWFGVADTATSSDAGLDLEMPGPARVFGGVIARAVEAGRVAPERLKAIVARWLHVIDRIDAWHDVEHVEQSIDLPVHRELAQRAASDSCVLLTNDGLLPLDPSDRSLTVALIGPRVERVHMMGGGSAQLLPHHRTSLLDVMRARLDERLVFQAGDRIDRSTPELEPSLLTMPDGQAGVLLELWNGKKFAGAPDAQMTLSSSRILLAASPTPGIGDEFSFRATTTFTPNRSGSHVFTLVELGATSLTVDGITVFPEDTDLARGTDVMGMASIEREHTVELVAGVPVELVAEQRARGASFLVAAQIGLRPAEATDPIEAAVKAAEDCDVAVVLVGTSEEYESEGFDRPTMDLPGQQDELVRRVVAANPRTVVLVNTGAPVTMPWADEVAAVVQVWLGGQEMTKAIDAVLFGEAEPAGRLPTTFPLRLEHNPTFGSFPGENDHHRYGEGLLVGYRWYDTRQLPVRFPFGHGGSYTTFTWGAPILSATEMEAGGSITVTVPVTNTGVRRGAEVVQCYVRPPEGKLHRPDRELVGFVKVWLEPGETSIATIELNERSFAHWDPTGDSELGERMTASVLNTRDPEARTQSGWWIDAGRYTIEVGASVADLRGHVELSCDERRIGP